MIMDSMELPSRRTAAPRQMPAHYDSHAALPFGLTRAVRKSPRRVLRKEMAMNFEPHGAAPPLMMATGKIIQPRHLLPHHLAFVLHSLFSFQLHYVKSYSSKCGRLYLEVRDDSGDITAVSTGDGVPEEK